MKITGDGSASTRIRILDAGVKVWQSQDPTVVFGGLSVSRVSDAAHVTRSTFYSYWPSTAEYVHDLAAYLVEMGTAGYTIPVDTAQIDDESSISRTNLPEQIVQACSSILKTAINNQSLNLRLAFLSKSNDPEIAEFLRAAYAQSDNSLFEPLSNSLEGWDREIREPFDPNSIGIILSTLVEGFAVRHRLDPKSVSPDLLGWTVIALLLMVTKRSDDHRGIEDIVDSINSWPAMGLATKLRSHAYPADAKIGAVTTSSLRDVTIAIRRLLTSIGFGELTISEIAARTGYSELTLQQMFGSLPGVAMCVLFINTYERYQQITSELQGIDRLRILNSINQDELQRNPVMAQNMMMLLSGHTAFPRMDLIDFDPRPSYLEAVTAAIESGELSPDLNPAVFSELLQRTALVEASPLAASTASIIDTVELVLLGAGAQPLPQTVTSNTRVNE